MKKSEEQEIEQLYESIIDKFDRMCHICGESWDKKKKGKRPAFVLHHREYPKGWKKWSDFPLYDKQGNIVRRKDGRIIYDKLAYLRYLIPLIQNLTKEEANRIFRLIHSRHHFSAEFFARHKQPRLSKMIELVLEIDQERTNGGRN